MLRRLGLGALASLFGMVLGVASASAQKNDADQDTRTALRFLQGLRERGYLDLALDYIDELRKAPDTPPGLKEILDYEEGKTLLKEAAGSADLERKNQQLEKARTRLDAFTKEHPNHRLAPEALVETARLLFERGQAAVLLANEVKTPADKQVKLNEARASFNESRSVYDRAGAQLKKSFDSYPKYIDEGDPRRAERDRAHVALMDAELQRTLVDYETAQTFPLGSKDRNDLLDTALAAFENVYKRYRTQLSGIYARIMQAKCYEEQEKLTEAMGIYKELMDHSDPALRPYQRKIGYFQIIVDGKRKEHALAVDRASEWLKTFPNALRTDEGLGVRLELAKNILAQLPNFNEADRELATRRATDLLAEVTRVISPHKAEAVQLLVKYKPKALLNANSLAAMPYDDAMAQADSAMNTHEWDRALAFYKQALRKADPTKDIDKANKARHMMAYCYYASQRYYEADVLAEHIARNYPRYAMAVQSAEIGMGALTFAYNTYNQVDRESDIPRLISLCKYVAETWPETSQADAARFTLGEIAMGRGDYAGGAAAFESVRANSPKRSEAMVKAGDARWRAGMLLREQGKEKEADAEAKTALEILTAALKARRDANVPPTDLGLINNVKALAEIHRLSGRPNDALALLEPLTQHLANTKPLTPELSEQLSVLLSMQLRAHIASGQADKAGADMKILEATSDTKTSRTQLYLALAVTLQKELEAEQSKAYTTNLNKTRQAYTQFLQALAASKADQTYDSLMFAGKGLLGLDKDQAKTAEAIFDRILKEPALYRRGKPDEDAARELRVKLLKAEALRKQSRFIDAQTLMAELMKQSKNDVTLMFEQGRLLEDWAASDTSQGDKAVAYWKNLATRLSNLRKYRTEYYEALYHQALTLKALGRKTEASQTLRTVMTLSPTVGSPAMKAKYKKLVDQLTQ